jgi:hypothetical protein
MFYTLFIQKRKAIKVDPQHSMILKWLLHHQAAPSLYLTVLNPVQPGN